MSDDRSINIDGSFVGQEDNQSVFSVQVDKFMATETSMISTKEKTRALKKEKNEITSVAIK